VTVPGIVPGSEMGVQRYGAHCLCVGWTILSDVERVRVMPLVGIGPPRDGGAIWPATEPISQLWKARCKEARQIERGSGSHLRTRFDLAKLLLPQRPAN